MIKAFENYADVEKLLTLAAKTQKFIPPQDGLTEVIEKYSEYMSEELTEEELEFAAAARMPEVPKYKQTEK